MESSHDSSRSLSNKNLVAEMEKILNSSKRMPDFMIQNNTEGSGESGLDRFETPKKILDYLESISRSYPDRRRRINVLSFDIADDTSSEEVEQKILKATDEKVLDENEGQEILNLLRAVEGDLEKESDLKVGDLVNWKYEKFQWDSPRRVTRLIPEEKSVFVEGLKSPMMISDLKKIDLPNEISEESKGDGEHSYQVGDNVVWDNEEKEILNIDDSWVEFKDGPIVARNEFDRVMSGEIEQILTEDEEELDDGLVGGRSELSVELPKNVLDNEQIHPVAESEEQINEELSKARSDYASALVEWKNEIRKKKGRWEKIKSDLGFEKPMPEGDKPQELLDAEKIYMEAKKKKAMSLFGNDEKRISSAEGVLGLNGGEEFKFNESLLRQAEEEYRILQKKISENVPPLEKSIITEGFEKWAQLPTWKRVGISSGLITIAGVALGSVALGGAAATFAYRGARSLAGATLGQEIGGLYGLKKEKDSEKRVGGATFEYGKNIDINNFEQKEKELAEFFEKEKNQKKKDFLKKAGLMAVVGAGANIGLELVAKGMMDIPNVPKSGGNIPESHSGAKVSVEDLKVKPKVGQDVISQKPAVPKVEPVKVELSSKGFIKTFDDMKVKLKAQYPDEAKMPKGVKEFMDTDNTKLAQKYGFYDPNKNLSGMGLKGESLSLDEKGSLHYNHLDGKTETIDMGEHKFAGKMFGSEDVEVSSQPKVAVSPENNFIAPEGHQPEPVALEEVSPDFNSSKVEVGDLFNQDKNLSSIKNGFDINFGSKTFHVDIASIGGKSEVLVDGVKVAEQVPYPTGGKGVMLQLLDKYQEGKKYAPIREAYAKAVDSIMQADKQDILPVNFENGRIHIVRNIVGDKTEATVLLNGKRFAQGVLDKNGPKIKLLEDIPKGGWLFADTIYERALKVAEKAIKS